MMRVFFVLIPALLFGGIGVAQQTPCYVTVENPGSYEPAVVSTISVTLIRQFIDPQIQPEPLTGFSEKACMYRVNITERDEGIKVFLLGQRISDYGTSNLRGDSGLEQALLRAIYKGVQEVGKRAEICRKYGRTLENECDVAVGTNRAPFQPPTVQSKPGLFVHASPAFTVEYPKQWVLNPAIRNPNVVFMATYPKRRAPALMIVVNDLQGEKPSRQKQVEQEIEGWSKRGKNARGFKVVTSDEILLKSGVLAHYFQLKFEIEGRVTMLASYVIASQGNTLITVSSWGPERFRGTDSLSEIVKSLQFQ